MAKTLSENKPTHEEIARRAYALFEKSGRVPGRDMQNWLEAESQLKAAPRQNQTSGEARTNDSQMGVRVVSRPVSQQTATNRA
jgi:hypothetical protein